MSDRMKVLSVSTSDTTGGAARAAYRIHRAVNDLGVESRMFVKSKGTKGEDVVALTRLVPNSPFYAVFDWIRNKCKNKLQQWAWERYPDRSVFYMSDLRATDIFGALRKLDYDVLHLHWINRRFLPLDKLPKDKPIVWTLHDSWPFCGICHLPMECRGFEKECGCCPSLKSDDPNDLSHRVWKKKSKIFSTLDLHIVAPSHWIAESVRKSSLLGGFDIHVIPNCIDVELFCPGDRYEACERLHLDPSKAYILFGAMNAVRDDNKGYRFLVGALSAISSSIHPEMEVVVFGSNDSFDNTIAGIKVIDMGIVRDNLKLVSLYQAAAVSVVPSLSENLSCTIMESLSCGTPVVAFDIGGNKDMVEQKSNGYLAKEKNSSDLAEGILWCLENNKDGHLSRDARRKVLETFTPEIVGKQYIELYSSLIKR